MTLEDRKKEIFSSAGNISLCQTGCEFESYNKTTKKANCNCDVQTNDTVADIKSVSFDPTNISTSFLKTLTNSNFLVLKCYKLAINFKNIFKNIGRAIMALIYVLFITLLFVYIIKDRNTINYYIQSILKRKLNITKTKEEISREKQAKDTEKIKKIKNKRKRGNLKNNKNKNSQKRRTKKNQYGKIKRNKKEEAEPPQRKKNNIKKKQNYLIDSKRNKSKELNSMNSNKTLYNKLNKNKQDIYINIAPITNINFGEINKRNIKEKKKNNKNIIHKNYKNYEIKTERNINKNKKRSLSNNSNNYNDQELNTLDYEIAIINDKRIYCQYYWSLLKRKQSILFTFLPANDYNLFSLKISLFLLSFSLYFTINGFFFSDDTMHKIHEDNGAFNIFFQIPQILYSSVISSIINILLKTLSLSENNILAIKRINDIKIAQKKSKDIYNCIKLKFIIFFIISNLLLLFFWYFITCFCAVYTNTQMILINDTLFSFALSMIYPFGLNLLPGFFRIPALRAINKDKKNLYKFSTIIALI